MFDVDNSNTTQGHVTVFRMGDRERAREQALREQFARFWAAASGSLRETYDAFISATPAAEGVRCEAVDDHGVRGWWVRPTRAVPRTALLYLHGGGYGLGSAQAYRGFVSQLAARLQVAVFVLDYPLAPESQLPEASDEAVAAWRWLAGQGCERIAIAGDSAGGGLALATLARLASRRDTTAPVAGVAFSPWTDLAFTGASMTDPAIADPLIGYAYLRDCARHYLGPADPRNPLASPLYGDMRGLPAVLIQVGSDELLLDDSRQYAQRAAQAGVAVSLEIWEGMHHVFQLDVAHLDSSRQALDRAARFLRDAFDRA